MDVTHFTAPTNSRPAAIAPLAAGDAFLDQWLNKCGLNRPDGHFEPHGFIDAFLIGTYDRRGNLRRDLSRSRYNRDENKYIAPQGCGVVIFAPKPDSFSKFAGAKTKWIAEGEGKALALAKLGMPVLGIGGVQNWHLKGQTTLHPDLRDVRKGDTVYLGIDGDWSTNPAVKAGTAGLMFAIRAVGAVPKLVVLPPDLGIDDQIKLWRDADLDPVTELAKLETISELVGPDDIPLSSYQAILDRPATEWIVKGLIPPGELTAIVGETSCGKTFLVMDLLLAVARKQQHWFGHRIKRAGLVVHITLEGTGLGNRLRAYQTHHKLTGSLPYVAIERPINLRESPTVDALIQSIERERMRQGLPVVLIAVDTVNRALGGGDENSSADMGAFLAAAERLKSAFNGCGVLLVHHVGKDASRGARGHSSFSSNVGAELTVESDARTGIRTVTPSKQREGRTDLQFNFQLTPVDVGWDDDKDAITSCVVEQCVAATPDVDATDADIYRAIFRWNAEDNGGMPTSRERVRLNAGRVIALMPKGTRVNRTQLMNGLEGAINRGWCDTEPSPRNPKGAVLKLKPPEPKKY